MRIWKLFCAVMVVAVLASVVAFQPASAAVATNPAPKVTVLALPFAVVDAAFPVLVLVKNTSYDCSLDKVMYHITVPQNCSLELPEEDEIEPYFAIRPRGYGFAMWFVECSGPDEVEITIRVDVQGKLCGAVVSAWDDVDITVYDV